MEQGPGRRKDGGRHRGSVIRRNLVSRGPVVKMEEGHTGKSALTTGKCVENIRFQRTRQLLHNRPPRHDHAFELADSGVLIFRSRSTIAMTTLIAGNPSPGTLSESRELTGSARLVLSPHRAWLHAFRLSKTQNPRFKRGFIVIVSPLDLCFTSWQVACKFRRSICNILYSSVLVNMLSLHASRL
jgi:hypothetical protein